MWCRFADPSVQVGCCLLLCLHPGHCCALAALRMDSILQGLTVSPCCQIDTTCLPGSLSIWQGCSCFADPLRHAVLCYWWCASPCCCGCCCQHDTPCRIQLFTSSLFLAGIVGAMIGVKICNQWVSGHRLGQLTRGFPTSTWLWCCASQHVQRPACFGPEGLLCGGQ